MVLFVVRLAVIIKGKCIGVFWNGKHVGYVQKYGWILVTLGFSLLPPLSSKGSL